MKPNRKTFILPVILLICSSLLAYPYRLHGPNGKIFYAQTSPEYTGIYPIDGGRRVAVIWGGQVPDSDSRDVYFEILDSEGGEQYDGNYVISDPDMVNSEDIATASDEFGCTFAAWLASEPGDTTRLFLYVQKITPAGELEWGVPTPVFAEIPIDQEWDFWYGSNWNLDIYPDGNGGLICATYNKLVALSDAGEVREDWIGRNQHPPEGFRFQNLMSDGLGGFWIKYWREDENERTYLFNRILPDGSHQWENPLSPENHFPDIAGVSYFPSGLGWQGGWVSVIRANDQSRLFIFDSLAQVTENGVFDLPQGVLLRTINSFCFSSDSTVVILYEEEDEIPYEHWFIQFNLNSRSFIGPRTGRLINRWDLQGQFNERPYPSSFYLGRGTAGEFYFGTTVHLSTQYIDWTEIHVFDRNANQIENRDARFEDMRGVVGSTSLVPDPDGGVWLSGNWPLHFSSLYVNHFDNNWNPASQSGFAPEIHRPGRIWSYAWHERPNGDNVIFFDADNGLRMVNVDHRDELVFPWYQKNVWVENGYFVKQEASTATNAGVIAIWADDREREIYPRIALFNYEGEVVWTRRLIEEGPEIAESYTLLSDPTGEVAILLYYRALNFRLNEPVLLWIDAASGEVINEWVGRAIESSVGDDSFKRILRFENGELLFANRFYRDPIIAQKFTPEGEPIWAHPIWINLDKYIEDVFLNEFNGIDVCGLDIDYDTGAMPWIIRYNQEGMIIDSLKLYDHNAMGDRLGANSAKWIKSGDNLWHVPTGPYFYLGEDTSGIQMLNPEGERMVSDQGYFVRNPDGTIPRDWDAVSDSVGGIWFWSAEFRSQLGLLHFTGDGRVDNQFPEFGLPLRADSQAVSSDQMFSFSGGDLGMIIEYFNPIRRTRSTSIQRFSLNEPVNYSGEDVSLPVEFTLNEPFPNPFNSMLTISFALDKTAPTRLSIYDVQGRLVANLIDPSNRKAFTAGEHKVVWDAGKLVSGIYLMKLESGGRERTAKTVLLK